MKTSLTTTMAAALFATAGWCGAAAAQDKPSAASDKADKTQVVPAKKDINPYPATIEKLDDNAQRSHDRDRTAAPQGSAVNVTPSANDARTARVPDGVRDWAAIDRNNDNLISPEEMEAALKEGRPSTGSEPAKK